MFEDRLLVWRFKCGSTDALRRIYEKYKNDLLALAIALSNDKAAAEDVVHDVFVSFAQVAGELELRTSLKSYLLTSVANRVRSLSRLSRSRLQADVPVDKIDIAASKSIAPDRQAIWAEQLQLISDAMEQLPFVQREAIILRLHSGLKFKTIADSQDVSVNTIQSRYRYGLNKLRSIINGEVQK